MGLFDEAIGGFYQASTQHYHDYIYDIEYYFTLYFYANLPLGTAYTVWTGIGAIGSFLLGILFLHEPMGAMRMLAAVLIVSGLVLMKLSAHS